MTTTTTDRYTAIAQHMEGWEYRERGNANYLHHLSSEAELHLRTNDKEQLSVSVNFWHYSHKKFFASVVPDDSSVLWERHHYDGGYEKVGYPDQINITLSKTDERIAREIWSRIGEKFVEYWIRGKGQSESVAQRHLTRYLQTQEILVTAGLELREPLSPTAQWYNRDTCFSFDLKSLSTDYELKFYCASQDLTRKLLAVMIDHFDLGPRRPFLVTYSLWADRSSESTGPFFHTIWANCKQDAGKRARSEIKQTLESREQIIEVKSIEEQIQFE